MTIDGVSLGRPYERSVRKGLTRPLKVGNWALILHHSNLSVCISDLIVTICLNVMAKLSTLSRLKPSTRHKSRR